MLHLCLCSVAVASVGGDSSLLKVMPPDEITFCPTPKSDLMGTLHLENVSTTPVAFKVRTNRRMCNLSGDSSRHPALEYCLTAKDDVAGEVSRAARHGLYSPWR